MSDYDNYEDLVDEQEDEFEQSQDISDGQLDAYDSTYPKFKEEQNRFTWFWRVVSLLDPFHLSKVGYLNNTEIGPVKMTMRDSLFIANLGHTFHHHIFGNFWSHNAKINSATSLAKDGFLIKTSITETKERARKKSSQIAAQKKWRLFQQKKEETPVE